MPEEVASRYHFQLDNAREVFQVVRARRMTSTRTRMNTLFCRCRAERCHQMPALLTCHTWLIDMFNELQ